MKGYVARALQRFQHTTPDTPQHSPHACKPIQYGAKTQLTDDPDTSPSLNADLIRRLQEIVGVFLFYGRAIDSTMLVALGTLASAQNKGTTLTMDAACQLLDYAATHPDAIIRFHPSDMQLHCHSDASYLSKPEAKSRIGGFFFLSSKDKPESLEPPPLNGAVDVLSNILGPVVSSATEAETGGVFHNAKQATYIRTILIELGWPQGPTPIQTDNKCAEGIINETVKQKRSKAMDMRYYWVCDRVKQGQFRVHWKNGLAKFSDYFTKHHPPKHHQVM